MEIKTGELIRNSKASHKPQDKTINLKIAFKPAI